MPCDVIGLDLEDNLGNKMDDYYGELHKNRIDSKGNHLSTESWKEKVDNRRAIVERTEQELKDGQGCRISGYIETKRVPGNFHIGHHAFGDIKMSLGNKGYKFDNSFKINHLSFGKKTDFDQIARDFPDAGVMHPLDGFE